MHTCPVCAVDLLEMPLLHENIDRCPSCNGIFFEKGELQSVLRIVALLEQVVLAESDIETITEAERSRTLACPADGAVMAKRDYGGAVLDACAACGGFWLDGGEIAALKLVETHVRSNMNLYVRLGGGPEE
jgi:Zn-finger nucleic acid-binding protein